MGLCDNKTNVLLVVVNSITVVVGVLITICGILGIMKQSDVNEYSGGYNIELVCYGVLITGIIIIVVGLLGWYAGYSGNATIAKTYVLLIILITLLQLAFCIIEYLKRDSINEEVEVFMNATFNGTAYADMDAARQQSVDFIQSSLECCGLESAVEWGAALPASCCADANATVACTAGDAWSAGCRDEAQAFVESGIMTSVVILAIGFLLEFLCIFAGCYIAKAVGSGYSSVGS